MRIAYLTQSYPPMVSGAATFARQLAKDMAGRGHHILVIAASDRGVPYLAQSDNSSVWRLRSITNPLRVGQRFMLPSRREVRHIMQEFKPDLIHTHDPFQLGSTGLAHARLHHIPVILSIHQLPWFVASYVPNVNGLRDSVERIFWDYARWLLKNFSVTIAPTQTVADIVVMRIGIRPCVISNGLDLLSFSPSRLSPDHGRMLRHKFGLPADIPLILHVGRLDTDKHVDRVIRAAAKTMSAMEAHLLVVGDGREKPALMNLATSLGIERRVHFPGFITMEQGLPDIYRLATVFVTASEIETQGIVLLEAAACGLPIAAVRATCIPEVVHHGENGFLTDSGDLDALADSLITIIRDPLLAGRMRASSIALARLHEKSKTMDAYEKMYRETLASGKVRREGMQRTPGGTCPRISPRAGRY